MNAQLRMLCLPAAVLGCASLLVGCQNGQAQVAGMTATITTASAPSTRMALAGTAGAGSTEDSGSPTTSSTAGESASPTPTEVATQDSGIYGIPVPEEASGSLAEAPGTKSYSANIPGWQYETLVAWYGTQLPRDEIDGMTLLRSGSSGRDGDEWCYQSLSSGQAEGYRILTVSLSRGGGTKNLPIYLDISYKENSSTSCGS